MDYPEVYAVEFDKTLNMAQKYPELGKPNMKLIEMLIRCRAAGDKIILWTCREGQLLDDAVEYCRKYGLEFDAINDNIQENKDRWGNNTRKVFADFYIDDRNRIFDGEELKMALSHPAAKRHGAPAITGAEEMDLGQQEKTTSEVLQEVREDICDNYCKYRDTSDEDCLCDKIRDGGSCPTDRLT